MKICGGGIADVRFLPDITVLIGPQKRVVPTVSRGKNGTSRSYDVREEAILTPAQLRDLDKAEPSRASGTPALLIEPVPWFKGKWKKAVDAAARQ